MTVMCIKEFVPRCQVSFEPMAAPEVGDEDTVTETIEAHGGKYYKLARFGADKNYRVDFFATLPNPSEEVAIEHEQEALIYQR